MEPPLESRACPLGLAQPRPGRRSQTGRGNPQARPANSSAPLILNRQESREKVTPFGLRQILLRDSPISRCVVTPCFRASRHRVRFVPSQPPRQNASLTFGVCHSRCFCRPYPSPARAALSFRARVWAFSAMRG